MEILSELTGVSTQTILLYQEQGMIQPGAAGDFDDETLCILRRIEHLRDSCGLNLTGLKLLLSLQSEVEDLRAALRARR